MRLPSTTQVFAVGLDLGVEGAMHRVVFEQVGEGGGIGQVVDGDDLDIPSCFAARKTFRPMRPKPLIATFAAIVHLLVRKIEIGTGSSPRNQYRGMIANRLGGVNPF